MAAAFAAAGRFDDAVETAVKAHGLASESRRPQILERLSLYRQKRPCRGVEALRRSVVLRAAFPGRLGSLVTDALAEGREVILFNGRGIASSTGKPRNRIEDLADDIALVIGAMGLSQVDLLGFSIGGLQVQEVALRHPELVRKLRLLGTGLRAADPIRLL